MGMRGVDLGERVHRVAWGIIECFFTTTSPTPCHAVFNCLRGMETGLTTPDRPDDSVRRHDVYLATIARPEARISQHQAFLVEMPFQKRKIHRLD